MYQSKLDYPEVKVEEKNEYYAKLLSNNYAGKLSEDTAIHQYFYQSLIVDDEELVKALKSIAQVEMHHLRLLGKTIELLGGEPIVGVENDEVFTYWNAEYVDYTKDVKELLKCNIMQEKLSIEAYEKHIEEIDDKYIKELLKRIIDDELIHIKVFYSFYSKLK